ncbi:MAG: hypothetical protein GC201_11375 [Alphaproteobacteria bacterium]|nr:hypothetical protein [Alphaproteobacteria bacterium]
MDRPASYRPPPRPETAGGAPRRVGVEIEFTGIEERGAAELVCALYGGRVVETDPHRFLVRDTALGDFTVELDASATHASGDGDGGLFDKLEEAARRALGDVARTVLPCEISCPPIPWSRLGALDDLIEELRGHGAQGTRESIAYAFGLQLNPEAADMSADWILAAMRAYLLLSEGLRAAMRIDPTRRVFAFAQRFSEPYVGLVLDPAYAPSLPRLMDDYLEHNPSRNRELDMLPLFAEIDPDRVARAVRSDSVKPRPTFHYRLPNCDLQDPDWGLALEWNRWVAVEALAEDREALGWAVADWFAHRFRGAGDDWPAASSALLER